MCTNKSFIWSIGRQVDKQVMVQCIKTEILLRNTKVFYTFNQSINEYGAINSLPVNATTHKRKQGCNKSDKSIEYVSLKVHIHYRLLMTKYIILR